MMIRENVRGGRRPALLMLGFAWMASGACASAAAGPELAPRAVMLGPAAIPAPPRSSSPEVAAAWSELRSDAAPVAVPIGTEATTAAGQALAGYVALRSGNTAAAQQAFESALAMEPSMPQAAYGMGLVAERQGRPDVARGWFEAATQYDPTFVRADIALTRIDLAGLAPILRRAEDAATRGETEAARVAYDEVIDIAPGLVTSYVQLADLLVAAGDLAGATAVLEAGDRRAGDSPALLESLGRVYQRADRHAEASDTFDRLRDMRPSDARLVELAREARTLYEAAALPPEYRTLSSKGVISREELAAILAINLEGIDPPANRRTGVIISDAGDRWSAPFVQRMVEWGILDVYQNNVFMPEMAVRRSMLVEACFRALEIVGAAEDAPRARIQDPPAEHLLYRAVQVVVGLGIMEPRAEGSFDLLATVSGAEAMEVVENLASAARRAR